MAKEIDAATMTKYLGHIYELEKEMYQANILENDLHKKWNHYRNPSLEANIVEEKESIGDSIMFDFTLLLFAVYSLVPGAIAGYIYALIHFSERSGNLIIGFFGSIFDDIGFTFKSILIGALICAAVVTGAIIIYGIVSNIGIVKRNKDNKNYVKSQNESINKRNENTKALSLKKAEIAKGDLNKISNSKDEIKRTLDKYYSANIIHPKYRNLVAISSLYEYFVTGRCRTLGVSDSGHEGAYNIFERELRENRIIAQLDQVIARLDQIIDNQQMLYSAIQECNANISRLEKGMSKSLDRIEASADVIAYNTQITRQNTEHLDWLETYNWVWN